MEMRAGDRIRNERLGKPKKERTTHQGRNQDRTNKLNLRSKIPASNSDDRLRLNRRKLNIQFCHRKTRSPWGGEIASARVVLGNSKPNPGRRCRRSGTGKPRPERDQIGEGTHAAARRPKMTRQKETKAACGMPPPRRLSERACQRKGEAGSSKLRGRHDELTMRGATSEVPGANQESERQDSNKQKKSQRSSQEPILLSRNGEKTVFRLVRGAGKEEVSTETKLALLGTHQTRERPNAISGRSYYKKFAEAGRE